MIAAVRNRRARIGAGALAALLVLAWIAVALVTERSLVHPKRAPITPLPTVSFLNVSFKSSDGITLSGWWVPGTLPSDTVVLLHGYRDSRADAWSVAGPFLHQAGYNVLAFDFRAEGSSDGTAVTVGHDEPKDVAGAVAFVQHSTSVAQRIALFGFSLGAGVALESAPHLTPVDAVIEDSGWTTLDAVLKVSFDKFAHVPAWLFEPPVVAIGQLDLGFKVTDVQPITSVPAIHQPLLAIIGDADTVIPPDQGRRIYQLAAGPKQLLEIPGAGHIEGHTKDPGLYESTVLNFLSEYLLLCGASVQAGPSGCS